MPISVVLDDVAALVYFQHGLELDVGDDVHSGRQRISDMHLDAQVALLYQMDAGAIALVRGQVKTEEGVIIPDITARQSVPLVLPHHDCIHASGRVLLPQLSRQLRGLGVSQQLLCVSAIRKCVGRRGHDRTVQVDVDLTEQRMQPVTQTHGQGRVHRLGSPSPVHVASCWRDPCNRLPVRVSRIISVHPSREQQWADVPLYGCRRCCSESGVR